MIRFHRGILHAFTVADFGRDFARWAPCSAPTRARPATPKRLRAIYTTEWQWRDEQLASNEDALKPIRDHLPKMDPASQEMRLRMWQDVLPGTRTTLLE